MQLARKGLADRGRESFHAYRSILGSSVPSTLLASPRPMSRLSFCLSLSLTRNSLLVAPEKSPGTLVDARRLRYAKDISARSSIPSRVIAHGMNFASCSRVKRRRGSVAHDARGRTKDEDEDVLRDEAKNSEGRLIRFYSPAAGRELRL